MKPIRVMENDRLKVHAIAKHATQTMCGYKPDEWTFVPAEGQAVTCRWCVDAIDDVVRGKALHESPPLSPRTDIIETFLTEAGYDLGKHGGVLGVLVYLVERDKQVAQQQ